MELPKGFFEKNNLIIIFFVGVILLIISNTYSKVRENEQPSNNSINQGSLINQKSADTYEDKLEKKLEECFSNIEGVGKVDVVITLDSSKEIIVNKDTPYEEAEIIEKDSNGGNRNSKNIKSENETVLINNNNGTTSPIILKENTPIIQGILISAQGGDDPNVRATLINASEILLDLPTHKIQVCKMK